MVDNLYEFIQSYLYRYVLAVVMGFRGEVRVRPLELRFSHNFMFFTCNFLIRHFYVVDNSYEFLQSYLYLLVCFVFALVMLQV